MLSQIIKAIAGPFFKNYFGILKGTNKLIKLKKNLLVHYYFSPSVSFGEGCVCVGGGEVMHTYTSY